MIYLGRWERGGDEGCVCNDCSLVDEIRYVRTVSDTFLHTERSIAQAPSTIRVVYKIEDREAFRCRGSSVSNRRGVDAPRQSGYVDGGGLITRYAGPCFGVEWLFDQMVLIPAQIVLSYIHRCDEAALSRTSLVDARTSWRATNDEGVCL